ncbi:MAG: gliding motility-associated C-terminal domain-containing protein [Crocinitomicaceae bacterium]|nr:gliding motility-associated C-terminal domain-containing protein [Crocinitomicaceae bacterium]
MRSLLKNMFRMLPIMVFLLWNTESRAQLDLSVSEAYPDSICNPGSMFLTVQIENLGGILVTAGQADISWTEVGSGTWHTENVTAGIGLGGISWTFSVWADLSTCGTNTFQVAIDAPLDLNPNNDTLTFSIFSTCLFGATSLVGDTICATPNVQLEVDYAISSFNPAVLDWITSTDNGNTWSSLGSQSTVLGIPNPQPNQIVIAIFDGGGICPNDSVEMLLLPQPVLTVQNSGNNTIFACDNQNWVQVVVTQPNNMNDNINWTTSGNGFFVDPFNDTTNYYFGSSDYTNPNLFLTASSLMPPQCVDQDSVHIVFNPSPNGVVTGNTFACEGDTIILNAAGGFQYLWYDDVNNTTTPTGTGNPFQFIATADDTLATYVISSNTCTDTVITFITVHETPDIQTISDTTVCPNATIQLTTTASNGAGSAWDWQWNPPFGLDDPTLQSPMLLVQGPQTFVVRAINPATGCSDFDTVIVSLPAGVTFTPFPDTMICPGNTIILQTNASTSASILWTPNLYINNVNDPNPAVTPPVTTTYIVEVSGICSFQDTVVVSVDNAQNYIMVSDSIFCLGVEFIASMSGSTAGSYFWMVDGNFQSSTNTMNMQPSDVDSMIVQCDMTTVNGCNVSVQRTVYQGNDFQCGGDVTSAFSPNGDGVNDIWVINGLDGTIPNTVQILTRYGDKLVHFENYDNVNVVWNGTNAQGKPMPSGVYYYVIEVNGETKAGWVNISK